MKDAVWLILNEYESETKRVAKEMLYDCFLHLIERERAAKRHVKEFIGKSTSWK